MKRIVIRSVALLCVVFVCDFLVGIFLDYMTNKVEIGEQGRENYISNKCKDDILVFGSSRALHHYDMPILSDSLGMSGYNCGFDGCGILTSYAHLKMVRERHQPKIIILDLVAGFDLLEGYNEQQLGLLKNRYRREGMAELFNDVDPSTKVKMLSSTYPYNSLFIKSLVAGFVSNTMENSNTMGYVPQHGKMRRGKKRIEEGHKDLTYDAVKLKYMDKFFQLAEGSHLYVIQSPIWYECDSAEIHEAQIIKDRCELEGIPFFNFTNNPHYMYKDDYFADGKHMNAKGAEEFTIELARIINEREQKK